MYDLSGTELVVWGVVILVLAVALLALWAVLERPAKRTTVSQRHAPAGDLRDPRGRWDTAPKVDRERDETRR